MFIREASNRDSLMEAAGYSSFPPSVRDDYIPFTYPPNIFPPPPANTSYADDAVRQTFYGMNGVNGMSPEMRQSVMRAASSSRQPTPSMGRRGVDAVGRRGVESVALPRKRSDLYADL